MIVRWLNLGRFPNSAPLATLQHEFKRRYDSLVSPPSPYPPKMPALDQIRRRYSSPTLPESPGIDPADGLQAKVELHARVQALKAAAGELDITPFMA